MLVFAILVILDAAAIPPATAASRPASVEPALGARLARSLATSADYRALRREVLAWHHTTRNACAAFVSTALRDVGVDLPLDRRIDGLNPSRITLGLAEFLLDQGWQRSEDLDALAPGNVVFTTDAPCCPGFPAHVFVFTGWDGRGGRRAHRALVIDNQGFRHPRALTDADGPASPFAYALRAPDDLRAGLR